jgi:predicted DsbA family dithiol-disulfide isomerase
VSVELRFQPFELNPQMGPGGQDLGEHLTEKYGSTPASANARHDWPTWERSRL